MQRLLSVEDHPGARLELLSGVDKRLPVLVAAAAQEQAFDGAAARHAPAEQSSRKHARVVDHQEVAGREVIGQRRETAVCDVAGRAIQVEEPRRAPIGGRFLGDQFGRQLEVEVADVHRRAILAPQRSWSGCGDGLAPAEA